METQQESYKQAEQRAKDFYGTIEHIWCPIPLAKEILADPNARFTYEEKPIAYRIKINGVCTTIAVKARFWTFRKEYDGKTVMLIIRQIDDHPKYFLSIFERTRKAAQ